MKTACIFVLLALTASAFAAPRQAGLKELCDAKAGLASCEEQNYKNAARIMQSRQEIDAVKQSLRSQGNYASAPRAVVMGKKLSDDFDLLDFRLYDWTGSSSRIVARIKSTSFAYTDWVKLYFYFYRNNVLVADDYSFIDFPSYGYSGLLPFHESVLETFVDRANFDSLQVTIAYEKADGSDAFLCDQILQLVSNSITPSSSLYNWQGTVNNSSTYSLEFPKIFANIFLQDSLINVDFAYLDTECQGNRSVIIDYVVDSPLEAQEIMLRNCSENAIDLSGWYLGDKDSPYSYQIPNGVSIDGDGYQSFNNSDINFTIDTQDEIIYLFDARKNRVDQWTKDENDYLFEPLTSCCYNSYLDLPESYDKIKYKFNYSPATLQGQGNIAPNAPVFTLIRYNLAPNSDYEFQLFLIDANDDAIELQIDWGDGVRTGWLSPFHSRSLAPIRYSYQTEGDYWASARTRDSHGATSAWSDSVHVFISRTVPVELAAFSAVKSGSAVILRWQTLSESNNLGFSVQRSPDKKTWRHIGFVEGRGTSLQRHEYMFKDDTPRRALAFYRLKQIDFDGSEHLSGIVKIKQTSPAQFELSAARPNPFNASTRFGYRLPEATTIDISVYAANGTLIQTLYHGPQDAGEHDIDWQSGSAPSGVYFIKVRTDKENRLLKCLLLK